MSCKARLPPSPFLVSGLPCARALTSHPRVRESESTSKESFTIVDIVMMTKEGSTKIVKIS